MSLSSRYHLHLTLSDCWRSISLLSNHLCLMETCDLSVRISLRNARGQALRHVHMLSAFKFWREFWHLYCHVTVTQLYALCVDIFRLLRCMSLIKNLQVDLHGNSYTHKRGQARPNENLCLFYPSQGTLFPKDFQFVLQEALDLVL